MTSFLKRFKHNAIALILQRRSVQVFAVRYFIWYAIRECFAKVTPHSSTLKMFAPPFITFALRYSYAHFTSPF
jgi:hypothetical protein